MQTELKLYVKSMGKIFRIRHIATGADEANAYCQRHQDAGVVAEDTEKGLVFIADFYSSISRAGAIPD